MTPGPAAEIRAALYVDFDNVFAGLAALDEWAAWRFAAEPARWLAWLAAGAEREGAGRRRLLLRRCYLNPAGWTEPAPGGGLAGWLGQPRLYYSRFRAEFVRAGFQVVDCPRLARLKNGADILMALDIADALAHPTRFEEFLVLSGDSDFTPLLHRLREHDRRTLLVAHGASAAALRAAADAVVTLEAFAAEAMDAEPGADPPSAAPPRATAPARAEAPRPPPPAATTPATADPVPDPGEPAAQREAIATALRAMLAGAAQPLHLPALGKRVHEALGGWVRRGRFGGTGTLVKLIEETPDLALEAGPGGGWLYDPERHERPSMAQPDIAEGALAAEVPALAPLRAALGPGLPVPRLEAEALDFALRGLAALMPLSGAPDPAQRAALAAEGAAAGLDLPPRDLDALLAWLGRARLDWGGDPGPAPRDRLARALFAELTRQVAAAGSRLAPEATAGLREWAGLATGRGETTGSDPAANGPAAEADPAKDWPMPSGAEAAATPPAIP